MSRVAVQMIRDRGANFRGEKVLFQEDTANRLVSEGAALFLDDNGEPILKTTGVVESAGDTGSSNSGGNGGADGAANKKKPKGKVKTTDVNPFEIDGFDPKVIAALADVGITNPEELRAYVASGKTLAELPVIGTVTKELLDLYGAEA
jgi:hypothetical protein